MQDHTPITTTQFRGILSRGKEEDVPFKYFLDAQNIRFQDGCFLTREGSEIEFAISGILRIKQCLLEGQAPVELVLTDTGNLYDATDSLSTPILSIPGMTDFSATVLNDRIYISPHNGIRGLPGEKVYVYDGGVVRPAAGTKPTTPPTVVEGGPGHIEIGVHCFTVVFESASGFISGFSPGVSITLSGTTCVNVRDIPLGPAGTIARHVLGTKTIIAFNGDALNQQYFFLPNGEISDNTTTILDNINYYDSMLTEEATYVQDALDVIPAGVHISSYLGSLVTCGEDAQPDLVRVSYPGEPENFDGVEGFIRFGPDGAGTVENTFELRGQLYVCKRSRTYVTQTNGDSAIFWNFTDIDLSKGTSPHGVGLVESTDGSNTQDIAFVCDRQGFYAFSGTFSSALELSWPIGNLWKRINKKAFHTIECVVDTINKHVYIAVPIDTAIYPTVVLYMDYSDGMSVEAVKWCVWKFPVPPKTIGLSMHDAEPYFRYASINTNMLDKTLRTDNGTAIQMFVEFAFTSSGYASQQNHYCGIALIAIGSGILKLTGKTLHSARGFVFPSYDLKLNPEYFVTRGFSIDTEKLSIRLQMDAPNAFITVSSYTIFCKPVWTTRPNYA
jgi:hypothetical protein